MLRVSIDVGRYEIQTKDMMLLPQWINEEDESAKVFKTHKSCNLSITSQWATSTGESILDVRIIFTPERLAHPW